MLAHLPTVGLCLTLSLCLLTTTSALKQRILIQGNETITTDVANMPFEDYFPYLVAVAQCDSNDIPKQIFCGASLIHPTFVLTAAHCVKPKPDGRQLDPSFLCLIHGTYNLSQVIDGTLPRDQYSILRIKDIVIHPEFNEFTSDGEFHIESDVALMQLKEPIKQPGRDNSYLVTETSNPGFVLLPDPTQYWDNDHYEFFFLIPGWGFTENATSTNTDNTRLNDLRYTFGVAESSANCRKAANGSDNYVYASGGDYYGTKDIPERNFCGGLYGGYQQLLGVSQVQALVCKGDSGGPAVIPSTIFTPLGFQGDVQIGIVSYGPPCPALDFSLSWPAVYADVSFYVPWIHEQIKAKGYTPLAVATSPVPWASKENGCDLDNQERKNCFKENVFVPTTPSVGSGVSIAHPLAVILSSFIAVIVLSM